LLLSESGPVGFRAIPIVFYELQRIKKLGAVGNGAIQELRALVVRLAAH
jgi:hypothetical protein